MKKIICLALVLLLSVCFCSCDEKEKRVVDDSFVFTEDNFPKISVVAQMQDEAKCLIDTALGYEYDGDVILSVSENTENLSEQLKNGMVDVVFTSSIEEDKCLTDASLCYKDVLVDAIVFYVSGIEGAETLTSEQIAEIYSGTVTDWSQLGFESCPITVFDCDDKTLSKKAFSKTVGADTSNLPSIKSTVATKDGKLEATVEFDARKGAIGYTTYSNLANIAYINNKSARIVTVDNITPTKDTVGNKQYKFTWQYYVVARNNEVVGSASKILYNWIISSQGMTVLENSECVTVPLVVPVAK